MDPITLSLLMAGGQALLPAIKSMKQGQTLKNLPDATRPDFEIPDAAKEKLGISRSIVGNRNMPGYDEALDKIDNQTNRMIGDVKAAGGNMQDIMAAMASANVGAGMAKRDLDIANSKNYLGSLQNLQGQLGDYASYENMKQQDEMKKYNDEMARRASLDTARQQNMQNAIGSIAQGAASGIGYQMNMNLMNKMYPGATPPVTPPSTTPEGPMKGIDISALPMPAAAPVNIQPQNLGPIAGQQPDLQGIVSSLQGFGIIPGTPTATPNVNQIQGSLQGQMGSDFASTSGMNVPASGAVMPQAPAPNNIPPATVPYNEQDVMNRIINMPEMNGYKNPNVNSQPPVNIQPPAITPEQAISSLTQAGIIPSAPAPAPAPTINTAPIQGSLQGQTATDLASASSALNSPTSGAMPADVAAVKRSLQMQVPVGEQGTVNYNERTGEYIVPGDNRFGGQVLLNDGKPVIGTNGEPISMAINNLNSSWDKKIVSNEEKEGFFVNENGDWSAASDRKGVKSPYPDASSVYPEIIKLADPGQIISAYGRFYFKDASGKVYSDENSDAAIKKRNDLMKKRK
jgi:hypothetical protein